MGIAFSGVGIGSITLLPWFQYEILNEGWRQTSITVAIILLVVLVPLNVVFQRRRPKDLGLRPDGTNSAAVAENLIGAQAEHEEERIVDKDWVATEWTIASAIKTSRFWWLMVC